MKIPKNNRHYGFPEFDMYYYEAFVVRDRRTKSLWRYGGRRYFDDYEMASVAWRDLTKRNPEVKLDIVAVEGYMKVPSSYVGPVE